MKYIRYDEAKLVRLLADASPNVVPNICRCFFGEAIVTVAQLNGIGGCKATKEIPPVGRNDNYRMLMEEGMAVQRRGASLHGHSLPTTN